VAAGLVWVSLELFDQSRRPEFNLDQQVECSLDRMSDTTQVCVTLPLSLPVSRKRAPSILPRR
jgi:hypothetical protein